MKNTPHPSEYQSVGPLFDSLKKGIPAFDAAEKICPDFDGVTYEPKFDATRLRGEMERVYRVMRHGNWLTLSEIAREIRWIYNGQVDPEASISARLRDLRKAKFGAHTVNRRRRGEASRGIWEYQLL